MTDLTLEQVREAGRTAYRISYNVECWPAATKVVDDLMALPASWFQETFDGHWHHLPGCDCEFCIIDAIEEAEREGTISLGELRGQLDL